MTPQGQQTLRQELEADEGLRLTAYQDEGGVWTCGYGATGPDVHRGVVWTRLQAEARLTSDIERAEQDLYRAAPWTAKLDDPRAEVMADLAFNLGAHGLLTKFPRFCSEVQAGFYEQAHDSLLNSHPWVDQVGDRAKRLAAQIVTGYHLAAGSALARTNLDTRAALERAS